MTSKITSYRLMIQYFKATLLVAMLCCSLGAFSQIVVHSVSPKKITDQSEIVIKTASGTTFPEPLRSITCDGIYSIVQPQPSKGILKVNGQRTEAVLTIKRNNVDRGVHIGKTPLKINDAFVYEESISEENKVYLEYVAPKELTLNSNSAFFVNEIFTNWDYDGRGFWTSQDNMGPEGAVKGAASPDNYHELIGYRVRPKDSQPGKDASGQPVGVIYSTGVDDALLEKKLVEFDILTQVQIDAQSVYKRKIFKAYSTYGVHGQVENDPIVSKNSYLLVADLVDKVVGNAEAVTDNDLSTLKDINGLTVFDAISNGRNGLELGTGVANFNTNTEVQFYSGNGQPGVAGDDVPDLLITQVASAGGFDIYYYADEFGDIVGRPIRLFINNNNNVTRLAYWKVDIYSFAGGDFASATPNKRAFSEDRDQFRPIWMAALKLEDFQITEDQVKQIENINMNSGGTADIAFMAYNQESFNLQGPVVKPLLTRYVCRPDGSYSVEFELVEGESVGIDDGEGNIKAPDPSKPKEKLKYQWFKNNFPIIDPLQDSNALTINNINPTDLGTYKLKIGNEEGNIIMRVDLVQGGTPYNWDGEEWKMATAYAKSGLAEQLSKDRGLIFAADYNEKADLEGCDCFIPAGVNVTISGENKLTLFGAITVASEVEAVENVSSYLPAGTLTLENNASLIQIKDVDENQNTGNIVVKRDAIIKNKYDYVYWSSPVEAGHLSMVPGVTGHVYEWDVNFENKIKDDITYGNWVKPNPAKNGIMETGRGYIKRVNDTTTIKTSFEGVPNNGTIAIDVAKTKAATAMSHSKHMNLIGNPYPSAISAKTFLETNTKLEGYVQIWAHNESIYNGEGKNDPFYGDFKYNYGDQYFTYNVTGSSLADPEKPFEGHIASGQGFFVQVLDSVANPTVTFSNNMRYDVNQEGYENNQFYRPSGTQAEADVTEKQLIWLSLVNENNISAVTLLGYADGATNGKDRLYDAGSGSGDMRIYSRIDDEDFLIQGRTLPFQESDEVPLGVEVMKNGIYNIGIDHLKGSLMLNEEQGIYLEDTYDNVVHNLRTAPYGFTATQGDIKDRFVLRYTNEQLQVDDHQNEKTFVYVKNGHLKIKAPKNIQSVVVYDLTGKKLLDYQLDGQSDRLNVPFQFSRGAYLTNVILENSGKIVVKKLIN